MKIYLDKIEFYEPDKPKTRPSWPSKPLKPFESTTCVQFSDDQVLRHQAAPSTAQKRPAPPRSPPVTSESRYLDLPEASQNAFDQVLAELETNLANEGSPVDHSREREPRQPVNDVDGSPGPKANHSVNSTRIPCFPEPPALNSSDGITASDQRRVSLQDKQGDLATPRGSLNQYQPKISANGHGLSASHLEIYDSEDSCDGYGSKVSRTDYKACEPTVWSTKRPRALKAGIHAIQSTSTPSLSSAGWTRSSDSDSNSDSVSASSHGDSSEWSGPLSPGKRKHPPPPAVLVDRKGVKTKEWLVDQILNSRIAREGGKSWVEYLVDWTGYNIPTWEPSSNLIPGCKVLVQDFHKKNPTRPSPDLLRNCQPSKRRGRPPSEEHKGRKRAKI